MSPSSSSLLIIIYGMILVCDTSALKNVIILHLSVSDNEEIIIQPVYNHCLNKIKLTWIQEEMAFISMYTVYCTCTLSSYEDKIIMILDNVLDS